MATKFKSASLTAVGTSATCPIGWHKPGDAVTSVYLAITNTPTLTANVEGTLDDIYDATVTPTWFPITGGSALTASTFLTIGYPLRALRLNVTAWTAGNAQMTVLQGDGD